MILFVFEGEKQEPNIFNALKDIFNIKEDIVCTYNTNIHSLYKDLTEQGWDLFLTLVEHLHKRGEHIFDRYKSSDITQIYLFFDYDLHDKHISLECLNSEIKDMLEFFNEETDNGKLYINYPMVESIRYTKQLPDDQYSTYVIKRSDCGNFKRKTSAFSHYADYCFLLSKDTHGTSNPHALKNWEYLKLQNIYKANLICNDQYELPTKKESITQKSIFQSQLDKYLIPNDEIAILNAFPIFLFEYFK